MIVFPAIDLKNGQVVRLAEGDMDRATVYGDDPAAQARLFAQAGASHLHVVDLDGSFAGSAQNREAVEAIVAAERLRRDRRPGHVPKRPDIPVGYVLDQREGFGRQRRYRVDHALEWLR